MTHLSKVRMIPHTSDEFIALSCNELTRDEGVGLWAMVPTGRATYGLDGSALIAFLRQYIIALLDRGAVPVLPSGGRGWQVQLRYGRTKEQIADSVISEWLAKGGGDPPWEDVWFKLPGKFIEA